MNTMKKYSFFLTLGLLIFGAGYAHAENTVRVSSNGNGNSETHVRIETDGEVNTFDSTNGEEVDWTSDDGKSTVTITKNGLSSSPTPSAQAKPTNTATRETKELESDNDTDKSKNEVKPIKISFSLSEFFKGIFSFFGFNQK